LEEKLQSGTLTDPQLSTLSLPMTQHTLCRLLAWIAIAASSHLRLQGDDRVKRFPETISPNGSYAIAWGDAELDESVKEVPFDDERFDEDVHDGDVHNYLISVPDTRVIADIPEFSYFRGPNWHANRRSLHVAWSPDSQHAFAIFDGRFGYESVAWIDVSTRKITSVAKPLDEAFERVLEKSAGATYRKNRGGYMTRFTNPVLSTPGVLTVFAAAEVPKSVDVPVFEYQLVFKVSVKDGKPTFTLSRAEAIEATDTKPMEQEERLNFAYQRLRKKLDAAGREALKQEELRWLKQREEITDEGSITRFVEHRIDELSARSDLQPPRRRAAVQKPC